MAVTFVTLWRIWPTFAIFCNFEDTLLKRLLNFSLTYGPFNHDEVGRSRGGPHYDLVGLLAHDLRGFALWPRAGDDEDR